MMGEAKDEQITVTEAAALYGFSTSWIRILLERGKVPGRLYGKTWLVSQTTLAKYLENRPPRGRQPKKVSQ
jgi:excisionase family DNA binding protein